MAGDSGNRNISGKKQKMMGDIGTTIMGYIGTTIRSHIGTTIMGYIGTDSFFGKSAASFAVLSCRGRQTCVQTPSHSNLRVVRLYLLLPTRSMRLVTSFWLARNEGMDPYSSPYITHYSSPYLTPYSSPYITRYSSPYITHCSSAYITSIVVPI